MEDKMKEKYVESLDMAVVDTRPIKRFGII